MNQIVMIELLNIAQKHRSHLESRGKKLALIMPLTAGRIASFTEQDIVLWDAWINRFCQLQDHMGMKLFDAFISFVGQDPLRMSMIDKVNFLEKLEIIEHAQLWENVRETRNALVHEYPNAPVFFADPLNTAFAQVDILFNVLDAIAERIKF